MKTEAEKCRKEGRKQKPLISKIYFSVKILFCCETFVGSFVLNFKSFYQFQISYALEKHFFGKLE